MNLTDFDFELPESLIASSPLKDRDGSRLLVYHRQSGKIEHRRFFEITELLSPGDLVVVNDTKVIPARLYANDSSGRIIEVFLLKELESNCWECLVKPGKRVANRATLTFPEGVTATLRRSAEAGIFIADFSMPTDRAFVDWIFAVGQPPLPPYIKRPAEESDRGRYQTVYAQNVGSVAAPTAGLHFTLPLLDQLRANAVDIASITLHVGYGTFAPIRSEKIEEHVMHEETFDVSTEVLKRLHECRKRGGRVIAVGTTSLRALESISSVGDRGRTRLYITPGYRFQMVDGLITNFHLPKSSLYILVCAMLGLDETRRCYAEAKEREYRFFSYGDAMAIIP